MISGKAVSVVFAMAVLSAVTGGFFILGTPAEQRTRRLDQRRVEDLRRLGRAIDVYAIRNNRLPTSIQELVISAQDVRRSESLVHADNVIDPTTKTPYQYRVGVEFCYELCASFQRAADESLLQQRYGSFWLHPAGNFCFSFDAREAVDKEKSQSAV